MLVVSLHVRQIDQWFFTLQSIQNQSTIAHHLDSPCGGKVLQKIPHHEEHPVYACHFAAEGAMIL